MSRRAFVLNATRIDESFRIGKWDARERCAKATGIDAQNQMPFLVIVVILMVKRMNNWHHLFSILKRIHDLNARWQCWSVIL